MSCSGPRISTRSPQEPRRAETIPPPSTLHPLTQFYYTPLAARGNAPLSHWSEPYRELSIDALGAGLELLERLGAVPLASLVDSVPASAGARGQRRAATRANIRAGTRTCIQTEEPQSAPASRLRAGRTGETPATVLSPLLSCLFESSSVAYCKPRTSRCPHQIFPLAQCLQDRFSRVSAPGLAPASAQPSSNDTAT